MAQWWLLEFSFQNFGNNLIIAFPSCYIIGQEFRVFSQQVLPVTGDVIHLQVVQNKLASPRDKINKNKAHHWIILVAYTWAFLPVPSTVQSTLYKLTLIFRTNSIAIISTHMHLEIDMIFFFLKNKYVNSQSSETVLEWLQRFQSNSTKYGLGTYVNVCFPPRQLWFWSSLYNEAEIQVSPW